MQEPNLLQSRWISLFVWLAVLAALVYSSRFAVEQTITADLGTSLRSVYSDANGDLETSTFFRLGVGIFLISQLLSAWLKFAFMTDEFFAALVLTRDGDKYFALFAAFVGFSTTDETDEGESSDEDMTGNINTASSNITRVLRPIAVMWAVLLVYPILLEIVIKVFDS